MGTATLKQLPEKEFIFDKSKWVVLTAESVSRPCFCESGVNFIVVDHNENCKLAQVNPLRVIGSIFKGKGKDGDFLYEIENKKHVNALYVFNDNFNDHKKSNEGGGNAKIRPYNKPHGEEKKARAAGVSTGKDGNGFGSLEEKVQENTTVQAYIDTEIKEIEQLIETGLYDQIRFSVDRNGNLGTGVFRDSVGADVKSYIVEKIKSLGVYETAEGEDGGGPAG